MPSKGAPPEISTQWSIPAEAEGSENKRAQDRGHRKAKARAKAMAEELSLKRRFPIQEVYRGDPKERTSHMNVSLLWAVLGCGAAKSLARAESAAMLAQACEKRGRKAGDDRKVEGVEGKYRCLGIGEKVITSFIRLQVPRTLGGTMCITHEASLMAPRHHRLGI